MKLIVGRYLIITWESNNVTYLAIPDASSICPANIIFYFIFACSQSDVTRQLATYSLNLQMAAISGFIDQSTLCALVTSGQKDISCGYVPTFSSLLTQRISLRFFFFMAFDGIPTDHIPLNVVQFYFYNKKNNQKLKHGNKELK